MPNKILKLSSLVMFGAMAIVDYCCAGEIPLIAIDVGHSTAKPGAISARGKTEFEFNVELARVIHQTLYSRNARSFLIGDNGSIVALQDRTSMARAEGASFFLSVHHDSAQPKFLDYWVWEGVKRHYSDRFSGFSLFVSRKNPQPEASLQCARMIGFALKQAGLRPTAHHAEPIAGENREWADQSAGVYYFDNLVVLKTAKTPAVLLEAGVIINRDEELNVQQPSMRAAIATAVAQGLADCKAIRFAISKN